MAMCEAENVFINNYMTHPRMRDMYAKCLLGAGGLMQENGVPPNNIIFTNTREGKAELFIAHDLAHFVDDAINVLTSIRVSCWNLNRSPLFARGARAKADGTFYSFERC